jgi:putative iron-dependent peroxidase
MDSSAPIVVSQPVVAKLTRAAIFLVVTVNSGAANEATVRALCADLSALQRAVGFRDLEGRLSCVMAFGSNAWDRLFAGLQTCQGHPLRAALRLATRRAAGSRGPKCGRLSRSSNDEAAN